jgi:hypothetical protein
LSRTTRRITPGRRRIRRPWRRRATRIARRDLVEPPASPGSTVPHGSTPVGPAAASGGHGIRDAGHPGGARPEPMTAAWTDDPRSRCTRP